MKRLGHLIIFLISLAGGKMYGQYTDVINSSLPGKAETAFAPGTGIYQFENDIFLNSFLEADGFDPILSYGDQLDFKTGFFLERLELNARLRANEFRFYQTTIFGNLESQAFNFQAYVGGKYLIFYIPYSDRSKEIRSWKKKNAFDPKRLIPAISLKVGYYLSNEFNSNIAAIELPFPPFETEDAFFENRAEFKLIAQQNLSPRWVVLYNISYETSEISRLSLSNSYVISGKWSTFVEYNGVYYSERRRNYWNAGFSHLINSDVIAFCSFGTNFSKRPLQINGSIGLSWRIDNHQDSYRLIRPKTKSKEKKKGNLFNKVPENYLDFKKQQKAKNKAIIKRQ